jgi:hypothetical protein
MSKNWFIPEEFECQCKNKRCVGKEPQMRMNPLLLQALNRVREEFKKPIIVTSGFRCPDHNKAIGGAIKSQHLQGTAADIRPASGKKEDLEEMRITKLAVMSILNVLDNYRFDLKKAQEELIKLDNPKDLINKDYDNE